MVIDIRDDLPDLLDYVRRRVGEHLTSSPSRPSAEPVRIIQFGFEFGQANWVALAFDTRPDAEPDGEWSDGVERFLMERPKWPIWHELPDDAQVYFIDLKGKQIDVMPSPDELICGIVGDALKHVLLTAREQGVFTPLPKADRCELGVENLEGHYGWPAYDDRGRENLA
jgi:hypothetical protein